MPFDANGNFSLVPGTIVADGMNVLPSQHNPPFQDVANGLSQAVVRDGRAPMTGPLNMNGNKITGVASGDAPDDVVTNERIADLGVAIGDGKWSLRDLSPNWLRRDGSLYLRSDYPDLADLLPPLPDGVLWETKTSGTTAAIRDLVWDGAKYTGVGGTDVISSENGNAWSVRATISGTELYGVAFGLNIYVSVDVASGKVYMSPDGDNWSGSSVLNASGIFGICYSTAAALFVIVGAGGYIATSDDGINWTARTSGVSTVLNRVRYLGGTIIAVGNAGVLLTSTDGITWTARTTGITNQLQDVAYDGSTYVAVGNNGSIISSTNLSSWTQRTSGVSATFRTVLGSTAGFMAAGVDGIVRIATNVATWSASATGITGQFSGGIVDPSNPSRYLLTGPTQTVFVGLRTSPTQFRVPNDGPNEWVRAL